MLAIAMFVVMALVAPVTMLLPLRAEALLVASSSIEYCERETATTSFPCEKKMIVTLSVESGQMEGVEEVVLVREAIDKTSSGGNTPVMFEPVRLTTQKSRVQYRYPLFYERNFNAQPYEEQISTTLLTGCKDIPDETATCGRALDKFGKPILYSEGFCCPCGFCQLAGLCPPDSRSAQTCNVLGTAGTASCLRFGGLWYSGYNVGPPVGWYRIQVGLSGTGKNSTDKEEATIELGPDVLVNSSSEFGALARIVGDFVPSEPPLNIGEKMFFVPAIPKLHPRVVAGPAEWMLLDKNLVTIDGRECNKVGISYEGFSGQGNRCLMRPGSCLANQLEDYRESDLRHEGLGGMGKYMIRFFGDFVLTPGAGATSPYISYWGKGSFSTVITVTISADKLQYLVSVSPGEIVFAGVRNSNFTSSSRDGVLTARIRNTGALVAQYTLSVGKCTVDIHPMIGQPLSLRPREEVTRDFSLYVQDTVTEGKKQCVVTLQDARGNVTDTKIVEFYITSVGWTNGTQGGDSPSGSGKAVDGGEGGSTCSNCNWYDLFCFVRRRCLWQPLIFVLIAVVVILGIYVVQKFLNCCECRPETTAPAEESVAAPPVVIHHRVHPSAPDSSMRVLNNKTSNN